MGTTAGLRAGDPQAGESLTMNQNLREGLGLSIPSTSHAEFYVQWSEILCMRRDWFPSCGFNLELVSKVNFSGEIMRFSKNDVGDIANLYRKEKKSVLTSTFNSQIKYQFQMVCRTQHQTITLLDEKHRIASWLRIEKYFLIGHRKH